MCACMCVRVCVDVCVFVWISKMFATRWMCRWTHVNWRQCNICIQQSKNADSVRQSERGRKSVRRWEQEQDNTESECVCFCLRMCERANEREKWRFTQNRVSLRWNKKITQRTQRKIIYDEKIAHSSITSHVVAEQQRKHHIIYMYKNWKNAQVKKTTRKKITIYSRTKMTLIITFESSRQFADWSKWRHALCLCLQYTVSIYLL